MTTKSSHGYSHRSPMASKFCEFFDKNKDNKDWHCTVNILSSSVSAFTGTHFSMSITHMTLLGRLLRSNGTGMGMAAFISLDLHHQEA